MVETLGVSVFPYVPKALEFWYIYVEHDVRRLVFALDNSVMLFRLAISVRRVFI